MWRPPTKAVNWHPFGQLTSVWTHELRFTSDKPFRTAQIHTMLTEGRHLQSYSAWKKQRKLASFYLSDHFCGFDLSILTSSGKVLGRMTSPVLQDGFLGNILSYWISGEREKFQKHLLVPSRNTRKLYLKYLISPLVYIFSNPKMKNLNNYNISSAPTQSSPESAWIWISCQVACPLPQEN